MAATTAAKMDVARIATLAESISSALWNASIAMKSAMVKPCQKTASSAASEIDWAPDVQN